MHSINQMIVIFVGWSNLISEIVQRAPFSSDFLVKSQPYQEQVTNLFLYEGLFDIYMKGAGAQLSSVLFLRPILYLIGN